MSIKDTQRKMFLSLWNIITNTSKNCKISFKKSILLEYIKVLFLSIVSRLGFRRRNQRIFL